MVRASEEWVRLVARANFSVRGVGVVSTVLDEEVKRLGSANEAVTADLR